MSSSEDSDSSIDEFSHTGLGGPPKSKKRRTMRFGDEEDDYNEVEHRPSLNRFKPMSFKSGATLEAETLDHVPMTSSTTEALKDENEESEDEDLPPTGGFGAMNSLFARAMGESIDQDDSDDTTADLNKLNGEYSDDESEDGQNEEKQSDVKSTSKFDSFATSNRNRKDQSSKPKTNSSSKHKSHLTSSYGIGAKLLGKMGYVPGKGLGAEGKGIVEPIQQKLRPTLLGLGGIDEKTSQAKKLDLNKQKDKGITDGIRSESTTPRPRTINYREVYKIISELENDGLHIPNAFKLIVNMTGEVQDLIDKLPTQSDLQNKDTASIYDKARNGLQMFARQWRTIKSRKQYAEYEISQLKKDNDKITDSVSDIRSVLEVVGKIRDLHKEVLTSNTNETAHSIQENTAELLDKLQFEFIGELESLRLDQVATAALQPYFKAFLDIWNPLDSPSDFRDNFLRWKILLRIEKLEDSNIHKEHLGMKNFILPTTDSLGPLTTTTNHTSRKRKATHFESLMYELWLPKVQSVLVNEWDVSHPASAILLLEEWDSILPEFIKATLLHKVILPKLKQGINSWQPFQKSDFSSPHLWIFPWLPYLGTSNELIMKEIINDIQLKFIDLLKQWPSKSSSSIIPSEELVAWKQLIGERQMNDILLINLVPRLKQYLRKELKVNPANQDMAPLEAVVVKCGAVLSPSITGSILESEFFPKWLDVLHSWLVDPDATLEDISSWYQAWSKWFPTTIKETLAVSEGFRRGLDLINDALDLNPKQRYKLEHPSRAASRTASPAPKPAHKNLPISTASITNSIHKPRSTFRDVVEDYCSEHDLFLIPQGKSHLTLGHLLYRVSINPSGQPGILCFFDEDVLWIQPKGTTNYEPISLEDLPERMN